MGVQILYVKMANKFIDIGANMLSAKFDGIYTSHGKRLHKNDLHEVLERAKSSGVTGLLVTGCTLKDSKKAVDFCRKYSDKEFICKCTIGVHPTKCLEFAESGYEEHVEKLDKLISSNLDVIGAVGECGVDNDR